MKKVILIDALSTIFRFKGGKNKYQLLNDFFLEYFGSILPISDIKDAYDKKRAEMETLPGTDYLIKWSAINSEIILELFSAVSISQAQKIARSITHKICADSTLYRVNSDARNFLKEAKRRKIPVIIASNQDADCLKGLAAEFNLLKTVSRICASSELKVEKPNPQFFRKILSLENFAPEECVMIGNNLKNDVLAAREAGIVGVLLDPENISDYQGYKISKLSEFWQLKLIKGA